MTRAFAVAAALLSASVVAQTVDGKLNGLVFNVKDPSATARVYSTLGFAVDDAGVVGFRDGGALEFYEPRDKTIPLKSDVLRRADIIVSSAERTALDLNKSGTKMKPPAPGSRVLPPSIGIATLKWLSLDF